LKHQKQKVPTFTYWERREKIKKKRNDQREQIDSSTSDMCYTKRERTQQHFQRHDKIASLATERHHTWYLKGIDASHTLMLGKQAPITFGLKSPLIKLKRLRFPQWIWNKQIKPIWNDENIKKTKIPSMNLE